MFKIKKFLVFIPLLAILVFVFAIPPYRLLILKSGCVTVFKPALSFSYWFCRAFYQTKDIYLFFFEYKKIKEENAVLKSTIRSMEELRLENERLRSILLLKEKKQHTFITCEVIGKDPSNWLNSLIINKGSSDGIKINQPVIDSRGLVGKIIEVTPLASKVILISDVNSRVIVLIQRTRCEGILEGIGRGLCRLKYLSIDADVELGDMVITSGIGGVYPKDLLVGRVESVKIERGGMYKNCIVKPAALLNGMEEVLCLNSDSGT